MTEPIAQKFLTAWHGGRICLHPTDTLPGLSVNPSDGRAVHSLQRFKQRDSMRTFISLVVDLATAQRYWQPLPAGWQEILGKAWPGPLSVVWRASSHAPSSLVGEGGGIALRCPRLSPPLRWMEEVLATVAGPLPTTSVNRHGEPPCQTWEEALSLVSEADIYIPEIVLPEKGELEPSTLIEIHHDGSYQVLRPGAFALRDLETFRRNYGKG